MKNNTALYYVLLLAVGIFVGWLIWGGNGMSANRMNNGMHMMPGGSMMSDNKMGGMGDAMQHMMAGLEGKTGDEFDKAFLAEMITHHEGAVDMAEAALVHAKHSEIKTMANAIISAQTGEIAQMKAWLKSWYGIGE